MGPRGHMRVFYSCAPEATPMTRLMPVTLNVVEHRIITDSDLASSLPTNPMAMLPWRNTSRSCKARGPASSKILKK